MPVLKEIKIVKVPLQENEKPVDYQPNFPNMPILYLELFENKQKIKQNLVNKDYVPIGNPTTNNQEYKNQPDKQGEKDKPKDRHEEVEIDENIHDNDKNDGKREKKHDSPETPTISRDSEESEKEKNGRTGRGDRGNKSDRDERTDRGDRGEKNKDSDESPHSSRSSSDSDRSERSDERSDRSDGSDRSESSSSDRSEDRSEERSDSDYSSSRSPSSSDSEDKSKREISDDEDEVTDRLKKLLADTSQNQDISEKFSSPEKKSPFDDYPDKYSQPVRSIQNKASKFSPYTRLKEEKENKDINPAPTLAELQAKGLYQGKREMININHIPGSEYEEEDKKRELLFKFSLLKKSYPLAQNIPEYTLLTDYREMQKGYDLCVKSLSLDSSVESYKKYLIFGSMGMELILGKILGFDMQGFTQQQILNMNQYEKLLIELGEKSYVPQAKNYPVEIRLLFLLTMNSGIFIVSKMLAKKTGVNLLSGINSMMTPPPTAQPTEKRKGRMKGPTINLEDLENIPK